MQMCSRLPQIFTQLGVVGVKQILVEIFDSAIISLSGEAKLALDSIFTSCNIVFYQRRLFLVSFCTKFLYNLPSRSWWKSISLTTVSTPSAECNYPYVKMNSIWIFWGRQSHLRYYLITNEKCIIWFIKEDHDAEADLKLMKLFTLRSWECHYWRMFCLWWQG